MHHFGHCMTMSTMTVQVYFKIIQWNMHSLLLLFELYWSVIWLIFIIMAYMALCKTLQTLQLLRIMVRESMNIFYEHKFVVHACSGKVVSWPLLWNIIIYHSLYQQALIAWVNMNDWEYMKMIYFCHVSSQVIEMGNITLCGSYFGVFLAKNSQPIHPLALLSKYFINHDRFPFRRFQCPLRLLHSLPATNLDNKPLAEVLARKSSP